jgi:hypothetical protein
VSTRGNLAAALRSNFLEIVYAPACPKTIRGRQRKHDRPVDQVPMPAPHASPVIHHLRRAALLGASAEVSDGQLLEGFVSLRDEEAFEMLVRRHGPMVFGVCKRLIFGSSTFTGSGNGVSAALRRV